MVDVLSQSQIDELLRSMNDEKTEPHKEMQNKKAETVEKDYSKYDFYSPRKFTKDKMKILTSIFENYARIITSQVNGIFRVMTDITVIEVQECRYYEFVNSLNENSSVTLTDVFVEEHNKNLVPLMLYISPGMVITLIDHMLGGSSEAVKVEEGYRYSDVETALYKKISSHLVQALKDGFSNYLNAEFKTQRIEENPSMIQDVGLDETVAIIHFNVDLAGLAVERIKICMPGTLLEYMFRLIDNRKHIARGYAYEDNREKIFENIRHSSLPVTGQLGRVGLELSDIYHLKVGDVIDMNKPKDSEVKLFVGKQSWFSGTMGIYKKNVAVRINRRFYGEDEKRSEETKPLEEVQEVSD